MSKEKLKDMREIKFKVWDNVDYMSEPFTLQDLVMGKIKFTPECEVMQFTGLTDKNGVEIYEGDVYIMGDINIKYVVVWHDSGLIGKQLGSSSYAGLEHWKSRIEIIGNIHEHKHLLK